MRRLFVLALPLATASCNAVLGLSDPTIAVPASDGGADTTITADTAMVADDGVDSTGTDSVVATDVRTDDDVPCTPYQEVVAADAPIHYWRLNETSGTSAADDGVASTKLPATYSGSVTLAAAGAPICTPTPRAARIAAAGGIVRVDGTPHFADSLPFSVEFWVNVDTLNSTERYLVGRAGAGGYWFTYTTLGVKFLRKEGGLTDTATNASMLSPGTWHHIVGVYTGPEIILYVDGKGSKITSMRTNGAAILAFSIGTQATAIGGLNDTLGAFDEVAIYDKVLTEPRVQAHYNAGAGL